MFISPGGRASRKRLTSTTILLDSITGSFNGATTTFNLTSSSNLVFPGAAQNLLVVLGGVVQTPVTAYSVSGSTITFSSAPSSIDTCSMIMFGPSTSSIATSVAGANTQIQFNNSGVLSGDANLTWTGGASSILTIGNSTVNVAISIASGMDTGNTTVNTSVNSTMVTVGTIGTTIGSWITNTQITVGNNTVNAYLNQIPALYLGAINSTAIGTMINSIARVIGNSSINATMNASTLSTSGPNFTVISTTTGAIPLTVTGAASATANLFSVGNATTAAQFAVNSTGFAICNGAGITSVAALTANSLVAGRTTVTQRIPAPTVNVYPILWACAAITIAEVVIVLQNTAAGAWASSGLYWGSTLGTQQNVVFAAANNANSTTGVHTTSFTNATMAANTWLWANVSTVGANTLILNIAIRY